MRTVEHKLVLEELVGKEPGAEDDHEVELLAAEEGDGVAVVLVVQVLLHSHFMGGGIVAITTMTTSTGLPFTVPQRS